MVNCNKTNWYDSDDEKDSWEVKVDVLEDCSKAPEKVDVFINQLTKCKIDALMDTYKGKEWLAYLIGNDLTIEDIFIPTQTVTSSSINDVICPEYNSLKVIGVIHSHNNMGSSFSPTDKDWINQNHNISICISDNSITGQVRWRTPCGSLKIIKANIKSKIEINFDDKLFINNVKEKIKEKTYNNNYNNGYDWRENYQNGDYGFNNFLTKEEETEFDEKVEEVDFDKEKTLEEELTLLEKEVNTDDKETN